MKKIFIAGLLFVAIALTVAGINKTPGSEASEKEQACIDSGGTVRMSACCISSGEFPNLCLIGACGCAPEHSQEVKICECPEGKCFDGTACI